MTTSHFHPRNIGKTEALREAQFRQEMYDDALRRVVREHHLAVEKLTEDQFVEALRQAIPDFQRNVVIGPNGQRGQQVIYLPGREAAAWKRKYEELLNRTHP